MSGRSLTAMLGPGTISSIFLDAGRDWPTGWRAILADHEPITEPAPDPLVSVVVPTKDSRHYLGELCEVLGHLDPPAGGYEVIIIDDSSRDGSYQYLQAIT